MKSILLTSTALVMVAGIAAADGHASLSWSGNATAGLAREGAVVAAATSVTAFDLAANSVQLVAGANTGAAATDALQREQIALGTALNNTTIATTAALAAANVTAVADNAILAGMLANLDAGKATAVAAAGDFKAYSEISTTATGTVTAGGVTVSVGMSVDAGTGYDFANDDGFDAAKTSNVGLDSVSIDMGTMGKLTLDQGAVAHLVDDDDDANADVKYSNTFAGVAVDVALDLDKADVDDTAAAAKVTHSVDGVAAVVGTAAVNADVQWSAKASMPIGAGSVFVAMDEEKGNHFGGSTTLSGVGVSFDSKIEALGAKIKGKRSNTLALSYAMGSVTVGGSYNSIKDGDQWGVSASYAAGDVTLSASTDEGSDWSVSGGYALGAGASVQAGVNYTEDAFLGLSFAF